MHNARMMIKQHLRPQTPREAGFRTSADRPSALLAQCPAYRPTPMTAANALAPELGISALWVKDETARMNLGSFKALGGAFAVVQLLLDREGVSDPMSDAARAVAKETTFITASAGNHGLSVAAGAQVFAAKAKVVLSMSVPEGFARRIEKTGAQVIRVEGSYEDSVSAAVRLAGENNWVHLADGSWDGYTTEPALVMEGYTVLAQECRNFFAADGRWPSHVVLQAGVGGLAAATAAQIRETWPEQPQIIIVEPDAAPCLLQSVQAGHLQRATGPLSNMGRLDCKEASLLAFQTLRFDADVFVTVSDGAALQAVSDLARAGIETTPSGAAGIAALRELDLPRDAVAMIIASEGPEG